MTSSGPSGGCMLRRMTLIAAEALSTSTVLLKSLRIMSLSSRRAARMQRR
jgi:hypothetical protein